MSFKIPISRDSVKWEIVPEVCLFLIHDTGTKHLVTIGGVFANNDKRLVCYRTATKDRSVVDVKICDKDEIPPEATDVYNLNYDTLILQVDPPIDGISNAVLFELDSGMIGLLKKCLEVGVTFSMPFMGEDVMEKLCPETKEVLGL